MFNVVNAYTRAAQFEGLTAEASYRLQRIGGNILRMLTCWSKGLSIYFFTVGDSINFYNFLLIINFIQYSLCANSYSPP